MRIILSGSGTRLSKRKRILLGECAKTYEDVLGGVKVDVWCTARQG